MSIVTMFFDQQKAGEINAIINNNFRNVSKYIPVSFDSLTTVERLNLGADWKEHGKLVFDIDQERVYMWDEDIVDWIAYLIEAKDSFARALAAEVQQKSFTRVVLGEDCILRFYNALGDEVGNQLLTADKIQYDSADTVFSKIEKLVQKDTELQSDIDDINNRLGTIPLPTDAQTITGAINELHGELDDNTSDLTGIKNGTIVVPEAKHAQNADKAADSDNFGGKNPDYYAKQSDMDNAQADITQLRTDVDTNTDDIAKLKTDLSDLDNRENLHYQDFTSSKNIIISAANKVEDMEEQLANVDTTLKIIDEDFLIEITESKASYESPEIPNYNPETDSLKVFINGGYVFSGNYTTSYDETTKKVTVTNKNHSTNPWLVGWEITLLTTRLDSLMEYTPPTPTPPDLTGLTAKVGQTLADVTLPTSLDGTLSWKLPTTTSVGNVGNNDFVIVFTPNDTDFEPQEITVTITVTNADTPVQPESGVMYATVGDLLDEESTTSDTGIMTAKVGDKLEE